MTVVEVLVAPATATLPAAATKNPARRFGDEATLLSLAAQLEQARLRASRRPPTVASMEPVVR